LQNSANPNSDEEINMSEKIKDKDTSDLFKSTNPSNILPEKFTLDSKLQFRCHPGVKCFTACCGNIKIILTPYDILQLKKRLQIDSDEFLLRYTRPTYLEKTDMPGVEINLDENNRCPFVTDEGCLVYTDRPSACRYYPVGMANFHERSEKDDPDDKENEKFFFIVREPHCKGFEEDKHWTIRDWRADQGVDVRDDMNRGWMELVMRRKSFGHQATLSEQAQKIFFMASTNLEKFKSFIFESTFLDTYDVSEETLDIIKNDDIELLKFSYIFLASSLFGTQDIKVKDKKIKERIVKMKGEQKDAEKRGEDEYNQLVKDRDDLRKSLGKDK
jgi:uncharacterized protein